MKKYSILIALWTILLGFAACQSEDSWNDSKLGYLNLEATTNTSLSTKSEVPENYKPKQLHVEIRNASGAVLYSTDDYEAEWTNRQFALPAGSYTIEAHSHGFDGQASGFNNPYYYGNTTATITAGGDTYAKVSCTLANVKVSVKFDSEFQSAFSSANVRIASAVSGITPLTVNMGGTIEPIYIPVGNFTATVNVTNQAGYSFSMAQSRSRLTDLNVNIPSHSMCRQNRQPHCEPMRPTHGATSHSWKAMSPLLKGPWIQTLCGLSIERPRKTTGLLCLLLPVGKSIPPN